VSDEIVFNGTFDTSTNTVVSGAGASFLVVDGVINKPTIHHATKNKNVHHKNVPKRERRGALLFCAAIHAEKPELLFKY
jgi:hypothetical protein